MSVACLYNLYFPHLQTVPYLRGKFNSGLLKFQPTTADYQFAVSQLYSIAPLIEKRHRLIVCTTVNTVVPRY